MITIYSITDILPSPRSNLYKRYAAVYYMSMTATVIAGCTNKQEKQPSCIMLVT